MTEYDGYNFSQSWRCYENECKFSGMEHGGGHPQAKAHHKATGHQTGVIQEHHFYYGYVPPPPPKNLVIKPPTPNKRSE